MTLGVAYETHITIDPQHQLDACRNYCTDHTLKWTVIELAVGMHTVQPMATFWGEGTIADQVDRARTISRHIEAAGGRVVRVKVEAGSNHPAVDGGYAETHIKLRLAESDIEPVAAIAAQHRGRLSRNARRTLHDGTCERFITQRPTGSQQQALQELLDALVDYEVLETEVEQVVYDSDVALDAGWF